MTTTEVKFVDRLENYLTENYSDKPLKKEELECLMIGYLIGSKKREISLDRLEGYLEPLAQMEGMSAFYKTMYQAVRNLSGRKEREIKNPNPVKWY